MSSLKLERKKNTQKNATEEYLQQETKINPEMLPMTVIGVNGAENLNNDEEEVRQRQQWSHPLEFLFSSISMSVGLGNVWRFPFTAYKNGGGAFLIPYLVVLFLIGKPLYFLELVCGQFSSYGPVKIWNMAPIFKGVGYGQLVASIYGSSYYCSIMALTIFYLVSSFQEVLPWSACDPNWAGDCNNSSHFHNKSLPELYFENEVIKQKEDIEDGIGAPEIRLTICLLATWTIIFITLVKGIKSSGKFAYFFATFPYVVLIAMLIRGITLPGAGEGILYFITPQWEKIADPQVWYAAVAQCFFSLGPGFGPIVMNASYNSFRHNIYRDAMIISLMDTFTSMLAGCSIFAILGNLAFLTGVDITHVAKTGPGLAFISYPQAVAQFDIFPQFFSVLFFLMLLSLGMGSTTVVVGGIITIICDQFPQWKRIYVTSSVAIIGFLIGLIYVTPGGQFMVTLVDHYGSSYVICTMAMLEVLGVVFIYGINNFCKDIQFMLDIHIGWYWKICWGFIAPIALVILLTFSVLQSGSLTYNNVPFPPIATAFGYVLLSVAISVVPLCAIHTIYTRKSASFAEKVKESIKPTTEWGPKDNTLKKEWTNWKGKSL